MAVTYSTLASRARQAADMENSAFIGATELLNMANSSYQELYDLIVDTHEDFFVSSEAFTLTSSDAGVHSLPSDFLKLRGLDYLDGGSYVTIQPYNWGDRNLFNTFSWPRTTGIAYRVMGSNLRVEPADQATGTYRMWYIPALTLLASDSDNINSLLTRAGWEEYIVVDMAIKMRGKEESDVSDLMSRKAALTRRIVSAASNRDADAPMTVRDVRSEQSVFGTDQW